ncbi:DHA2 family efflux MFS transporter permease subunit [Candidatus Entotheonella palauensis]|uniref:DHA2 family efflux MFS transporter permease subunit n=1 Tax=Candidatus Entotheonella palauensis TaxID=93172 RepID=UPI000B7D7CCC|nr:DHA2 family efflux MFS transporter permease subunit [Candidatus Entotheonella palauensis]
MQAAPSRSHWWPTVGVLLGVLNIAIPSMMRGLGTDLARIQWVQTGYQIAQVVMIPAVGWLGAQLGTKRLYLLAMLAFMGSSCLCGLAWDVNSLIFFRVLQGLASGPIMPLGMSILHSTFPPEKRGFAMGLSNFSFSFGPAVAPALGGHLIEILNWRVIFYINVPIGLLCIAIVYFMMPPTEDRQARPFDAIGVFSMAGFLVLLLLALSEGRRYGWHSPSLVAMLVAAGILLIVFIVAELTTDVPFVELRLYQNSTFAMGCLISFLITMEFRGTNFLLPIMLQRIYHYPPFQAGLFFLPPALLMGMMSIVSGRLADRFPPKILLVSGLVALIYASLQFCTIEVGTTGAVLLGLILMRRGAQSFCNTPLTLFSLRHIPDEQLRMATGLFSLHRNLAGAVGVALSATLLGAREELHQVRYADRQMLYPMGLEHATEIIREFLVQSGQAGAALNRMTTAVLHQRLVERAAMASYHDLFAMFAILAVVCLVPVLLLRSGQNVTSSREHTPSRIKAEKPSKTSERR